MSSDRCSSSGLSPSQRSMRARLAAHAMHARHDSREVTTNARQAFVERFERQVDPTVSCRSPSGSGGRSTRCVRT